MKRLKLFEERERERKGYNAKQHVTICLRVLRRIDGADLMEGKKAGFGLRLALLYHLEMLQAKLPTCCCLINFFPLRQ